MKIFKKRYPFIIALLAMALLTTSINVIASSLGKQLNNPESGWTRFDDTNRNIDYSTEDILRIRDTSVALNYSNYTITNVNYDSKASFKFLGTGVRIIGVKGPSTAAKNATCVIDGIPYTYSNVSSTRISQCVLFESIGLDYGLHTVEIYSATEGSYINLDAFDIFEGEIIDYYKPINLIANTETNYISLKWDNVEKASSYNIKRSLTANGPYENIATTDIPMYNDLNVIQGINYYYVVSSVVSSVESGNSNEANAFIEVVKPEKVLKIVLEKEEVLQLSVDKDLDTNIKMNWSSSDNAVAIVDGNGIVTGKSIGNTVITVTSKDGEYTDYVNVLVVENEEEYRLSLDLKIGMSSRLTINDINSNVEAIWNSSNTSVATVSDSGIVKAIAEGLTLITAIDENGNIIDEIYVRVRDN